MSQIQVANRRKIIGSPTDMAINAITLLEKPGGRRDLARRSIQSNYIIDLITGTNLFSNLNDNLYMSNILELAKILDLPITKTSSKADIFKLITQYVVLASYTITNDYFPLNTELKDAEFLLWKSIHQISRGRATISAGGDHSLGLLEDGTVLARGSDAYGQTAVPKTDKKFVAISAGYYHSLGLLEDGSILVWGDNRYGQTTIPKTDKKFIAISAGYCYSLGLLEDGSVLAWGINIYGETKVPETDKKFIALSAGGYHSLGLLEDGSILAWGCNSYGETTVPKTEQKFIAISSGAFHSLGLLENGSVLAWGLNDRGQTAVPKTDKKIIAISSGLQYSLGLLEDGSVLAWGDNRCGQTVVPKIDKKRCSSRSASGWSKKKFISISAGAYHSLGLLEDGSVLAWGVNGFGQTIVPITDKKFMK